MVWIVPFFSCKLNFVSFKLDIYKLRYCHLSQPIDFLLGLVKWISMLDILTWTALMKSNNRQTRWVWSVNAEWPLHDNGESGPLCFYHSPLKRPYLLHLTMQWYHLKIFLHTWKLCFWPMEVCCNALFTFSAIKNENFEMTILIFLSHVLVKRSKCVEYTFNQSFEQYD